ncbi:MAG: NUDIX hydrolase [Deinococcales bacterium]
MMEDIIYQGKILDLIKLDKRWEIVRHAPAVCILALQGDKVLGVRQYRPAIAQETWEVPAGLIDEGESPDEAALRELSEETQLGGKLKRIAEFYTSPGFCDEKIYLFEATELYEHAARPDEGENLQAGWEKLADIWQALCSGRVASSAPTLLALSYALGLRASQKL